MIKKIGLYRDTKSSGVRWYVRWYGSYDPNTEKQRRYSKTFTRKKDAENFIKRKEKEFEQEMPRDPSDEKLLSEFCVNWLEIKKSKVRPSTLKLYEQTAGRLLSYFGDSVPLKNITSIYAEKFIASLKPLRGQTLSNWAIHREIRNCRAMFSDAVEWSLIVKNPFKKVTKPKCITQPWYYLRPVEYQKLLQVSPNLFWKARYSLAYLCGLRFGEVFNLRWAEVDFERREIHIVNRPDAKPPFYIKDYQARTIPLPQQAIEILDDLRAFCELSGDESPYVCLDEKQYCDAVRKYKKYTEDKRSWRNQDIVNNVGRELKRHLRKAEIVPDRQFSFHTLRKCAAKNWARINRDPNITKEFMGHSSIATTMKFYDQITEQDRIEAASAIDALIND